MCRARRVLRGMETEGRMTSPTGDRMVGRGCRKVGRALGASLCSNPIQHPHDRTYGRVAPRRDRSVFRRNGRVAPCRDRMVGRGVTPLATLLRNARCARGISPSRFSSNHTIHSSASAGGCANVLSFHMHTTLTPRRGCQCANGWREKRECAASIVFGLRHSRHGRERRPRLFRGTEGGQKEDCHA